MYSGKSVDVVREIPPLLNHCWVNLTHWLFFYSFASFTSPFFSSYFFLSLSLSCSHFPSLSLSLPPSLPKAYSCGCCCCTWNTSCLPSSPFTSSCHNYSYYLPFWICHVVSSLFPFILLLYNYGLSLSLSLSSSLSLPLSLPPSLSHTHSVFILYYVADALPYPFMRALGLKGMAVFFLLSYPVTLMFYYTGRDLSYRRWGSCVLGNGFVVCSAISLSPSMSYKFLSHPHPPPPPPSLCR